MSDEHWQERWESVQQLVRYWREHPLEYEFACNRLYCGPMASPETRARVEAWPGLVRDDMDFAAARLEGWKLLARLLERKAR